jgi:hypothetical protein
MGSWEQRERVTGGTVVAVVASRLPSRAAVTRICPHSNSDGGF